MYFDNKIEIYIENYVHSSKNRCYLEPNLFTFTYLSFPFWQHWQMTETVITIMSIQNEISFYSKSS